MSSLIPQNYRSSAIAILLALGLMFGAGSSDAQAPSANDNDLEQLPSRSARAALEQVALSADKIIDILRVEPGLVLAFKTTLVRKAYEQGRLLDPADLTDEAVERLIRDDSTIRVLATREIESRSYVRAKPTREEIERSGIRKTTSGTSASATAPPAPQARTQEEAYWATHEEEQQLPSYRPTLPESSAPGQYDQDRQQQELQPPSRRTVPQPAAPADRRRELQRAEAESSADTLGSNTSRMARISPDELPDLLAGSTVPAAQRIAGRSESTAADYASSDLTRRDSLASTYGVSPDSAARAGQLRQPYRQYPQAGMEASLDRRTRPTLPGLHDRGSEPSMLRRRPNPYADVPSLYDLYLQVTKRPPLLQRFGADVFINGSGNAEELPIDMPAGPDYVLGPGDGISIELWGGISQRLQRVVDREGRVALPEVGSVQVAGRNLGDVQRQIQAVLRTQFRDVQADVSLSRLRTVRAYVVGDVERPGAYDISSLSTPLNALLMAGGPTARGSLRTLKHYRGSQLIQTVDVYDLLLHGIRSDVQRIEAGDTILVPPIGPQVTVTGMVRRPAIYELNGEQNLAEALELAGGVLSSGTLRHIDVERVQAHEQRMMLSLDLPEANDQQSNLKSMEAFKVQDGDQVRISPILPYSYKTVYLDGHVFHPGKYPYHDGMKVTDLIKAYSDLLPEPSRRHAEIIRLNPPDFAPAVLAFNLEDALAGKGEVPILKPFDTVRIFGRYDFEDPPEILVTGEVREPGEKLTNGETHLRDAVYLAGGVTPDTKLTDAEIYRKLPGGGVKVISVNLGKALAGDPVEDVLLESRDRVIIHRDLTKVDPPTVTIAGEVAKPGRYPLGENMTAAELVRVAGGFKRGAYTRSADLSRYVVENGKKILGEHQEIPIARAMAGVADTDVRLFDGDVLTIRQLAGWTEVGASISVKGEVSHAGTYGIEQGERLSSILKRAGGFTANSYPYGAVLERVQVREFSEKNRQDMIHRIEAGGNLNVSGNLTGQEQAALAQAAMQQQQQVLTALRNQAPSGRLVIHISSDIRRWQNTSADIEVRAGDVLLIPKRPNFVLISGQVYNASAVSYAPAKNAGWYLQQTGGPTNLADKKNIFIIRADGSVIGHSGSVGSGFWHGNVLSTRLEPGDSVVVPEKFISGSSAWKEVMTTAQFISSMAIAARVATSF
jgi:protein involved in polysaccharide export with SLBB domain